jgi:hypothetical protein
MLLLGLGVLSLAACSADSTGDTAVAQQTSAGAAAAGTEAAVPAGFTAISGTALRFALPTDVAFVQDEDRVTDDGQVVKRWRFAVTPTGPFCLALTVEQADFTGDYPGSVVALFAANTQPDQKTLRNEVMQPNPPKTIGGVDQESTFTSTLDDGTTVASHFYQRKYLTPGHSLITLGVAGPETELAACHLPEIIGTFAATGHEFTAATPSTTAPETSAPTG